MSIKVDNLTYVYGIGTPFEKKALESVSLAIESGQFVGLIGHTGSGKSTLIQHFNRLLKPTPAGTSGQVFVNGVDINGVDAKGKPVNIKAIRQQVGLVFQYPEHQLFEMTIYKDVAFGPTNMGLTTDEIDERVRGALTKVGIDEADYEKSPFELSGGQKRRVAIAGVLAMQPDVLILDEPTAGLDPQGSHDILMEIQKIHDLGGITIILVSHNMEDIASFVERIIVMDQGAIRYDGTPKEVFREVDALEAMGLAVPQVSYLIKALREKGYDLPGDVTTVEEAYEALRKLIR
ncbi:MAG: energy-coupling factor transporter ATPase [Vallitaleaceae bacterium]|jgi:energy-coupling factor transport system ATP-binding protein|nr:energy-coupling factor transporter ATPase [Vallitaleaceae bacterium]